MNQGLKPENSLMRNKEIQMEYIIRPHSPRVQWTTAAGLGVTLMILGYIGAGFVSPDFSDLYGGCLVTAIAVLGLASIHLCSRNSTALSNRR
jgi:hypothetical protein